MSLSVGGLDFRVTAPVMSPGGGSYNVEKSVTLTTATSGASIYYTTDGSDPTTSDSLYTGTIFDNPTNTLDGSAPTESSPTVPSGNAVAVSESGTLTVRSFNGPGWTPSDVKLGTFHISQGTAATPTADPAAGTFSEAQLVSLSSTTTGAMIRYTLDGSEPTWISPVFTKPILVDWSMTVKANAFLADCAPSSTLSAAYTINLASTAKPPAFDPPGGTYTTTQTVALTTGTTGALIYYTTNGVDPTTSDSSVSSGGTVAVGHSLRLKAMTLKSGLTDSPVRAEDYLVTGGLDAGYQHTLAVKTDGSVLSWGATRTAPSAVRRGGRGAPAAIPSFSGVMAVAVNRDTFAPTSFAVKGDGSLWGWGNGQYGKLGNGGTSNQSSPTQVSTGMGLTNAVAVAAGAQHTLALKSDATVWAWGGRYEGALGDGTSSGQVTTPQQVSGLSNIVAIAAGYRLSVALKSDGSV